MARNAVAFAGSGLIGAGAAVRIGCIKSCAGRSTVQHQPLTVDVQAEYRVKALDQLDGAAVNLRASTIVSFRSR